MHYLLLSIEKVTVIVGRIAEKKVELSSAYNIKLAQF